MKIIILIIFLIIIFQLLFYPINIYENLYMINLMKNINIPFYNNDFFKISIYKSKFDSKNFMLIIHPQQYHFFIENEKLIYHPNNKYLDGILKQYFCNNDDNFELAYNLNINVFPPIPKVICHKNLKYLKTNIYFNQNIYTKYFDELQNPINAIKMIINDIIKNEKTNINE